jgi:hypothetical protein
MYERAEIKLYKLLTSVLGGCKWSASRSGGFNHRGFGTHWIGGWVGPRASVDTVMNIYASLCPCLELNGKLPVRSLDTILTELARR